MRVINASVNESLVIVTTCGVLTIINTDGSPFVGYAPSRGDKVATVVSFCRSMPEMVCVGDDAKRNYVDARMAGAIAESRKPLEI